MDLRRTLPALLIVPALAAPAAALAQSEQPAPDVLNLKVAPAKFKAAATGPDVLPSGGAIVSFRIADASTVTFTLQAQKYGVRRGGRCAPGTTKTKSKRCTRNVAVPGELKLIGISGENEMNISGRWQGVTLKPGRYRLGARATGLAPRAAFTTFTIVR